MVHSHCSESDKHNHHFTTTMSTALWFAAFIHVHCQTVPVPMTVASGFPASHTLNMTIMIGWRTYKSSLRELGHPMMFQTLKFYLPVRIEYVLKRLSWPTNYYWIIILEQWIRKPLNEELASSKTASCPIPHWPWAPPWSIRIWPGTLTRQGFRMSPKGLLLI